MWHREPESKAALLAKTFSSKYVLPPEICEIPFFAHTNRMSSLNVIRTRCVKRELTKLRLDQATGADKIAAVFLKRLAKPLAVPVVILARRMFREARWPDRWRIHYLYPLFKKGSAYDPNNYRGLHLTSILSKVIERSLGHPLVEFLQQQGFGDSQWAFRKCTGATDLVMITLTQWVMMVYRGRKIGVYFADTSGAFDRVWRPLLLGKLADIGVPSAFLMFLNDYLQPR